MKLFLTLLALLTGLAAAPAQARMSSAESSAIERVEGPARSGASAIAAVPAVGGQAAQCRRRERDAAPLRVPGVRVVVPSIQYGDRARE